MILVFFFEASRVSEAGLCDCNLTNSIPTRGNEVFNIFLRSGVETNRGV